MKSIWIVWKFSTYICVCMYMYSAKVYKNILVQVLPKERQKLILYSVSNIDGPMDV